MILICSSSCGQQSKGGTLLQCPEHSQPLLSSSPVITFWMTSADGYGGLKLCLACSFCKVCNSFLWLILSQLLSQLGLSSPCDPNSAHLLLQHWINNFFDTTGSKCTTCIQLLGRRSIVHTIFICPEQDALPITWWALVPGDFHQGFY